MKTLNTLLIFLVLLSCADSKKERHNQTKIDLELVDEIYIIKRLDQIDSIRLNKVDTKLFVSEWNNAKFEGLYKMGSKFWVILKLKNDSIRKFTTNRNLIKENKDWTYSLTDSTIINSMWKSSIESESLKFKQVVFGRYCGECDENCAPMFRLLMDKKEITLSADFEDTYFNLKNNLEFKTDINQEKKLQVANEIVSKIPKTLYNWKTDKEIFGCPDCDDGCGYYLTFIKENGESKTFELDNFLETENIPKDVLEFTHFLAEKIKLLTK